MSEQPETNVPNEGDLPDEDADRQHAQDPVEGPDDDADEDVPRVHPEEPAEG